MTPGPTPVPAAIEPSDGFAPSAPGQFVAMIFCQLGRAHSLREIAGGLRTCEGELKHLGISAPNRSTLAYANEHRPWELYQKVFLQLLHRRHQLPDSGRTNCLFPCHIRYFPWPDPFGTFGIPMAFGTIMAGLMALHERTSLLVALCG